VEGGVIKSRMSLGNYERRKKNKEERRKRMTSGKRVLTQLHPGRKENGTFLCNMARRRMRIMKEAKQMEEEEED